MNLLFAVFVVLALAVALVRAPGRRQAVLLAASYVFYAAWGLGFLIILIASSLLNYFWGAALRRRVSVARLWVGVGLNILLLAYCKYILALLDGEPSQAELLSHFIRPIGLSFWTLQGLSYLIDVYREEELDPSLTEFCLYMAFWPTVLSGPICRLPEMLPQFRQISQSSWDDVSVGATRVVQGLFMKMVLAQLLGAGLTPGAGVAVGFDAARSVWSGLDVWFLAVGFGFQLFFDFAGYSHIVIGAARLFGYRLAENFDRPYLSQTPSIFWARWHMSFSFWIRDYVFIPLATMRRESWWPYLAIVLSMALVGLWHEARTMFILWGVYHGVLLVTHRAGQQLMRLSSSRLSQAVGPWLLWLVTFSLVSLGWILFRAHDPRQAAGMFRAVLTLRGYFDPTLTRAFYVTTAAIMIGYFALAALASVWTRLTSYYAGEGATQPTGPGRLAVELVEFTAQRRWWWLGPALVVIMIFAGLALVDRPVAVPTTPFMYTLF